MEYKNEFTAIVSSGFSIADGVMIRYIDESPEISPVQLVVVIDEFTDFDAINKNRKALKNLLTELEVSQGANLNNPITGNQYGFYQWHKDGVGPKAMTSILNYIGLALILLAHDKKQNIENLNVYFDKRRKINGSPFLSNAREPEQFFKDISMAAGLSIHECIEHINHAHRALTENSLPWGIKDGPFMENKLKDRLKYFRKKVSKKSITISQIDANLNRLEIPVYLLHLHNYFVRTNELLDKRGGQSWNRSKTMINKQISKIVNNWNSSQDKQTISVRNLYRKTEEKD